MLFRGAAAARQASRTGSGHPSSGGDPMQARLQHLALLPAILAAWPASGPAAADYRTAVEAFQSGRFEEACAEFDELVEQSPAYDFGHFVVGQCAAADGRHDEAARHFETAVELNPARADYRCQLAGERLRAGLYADAIALLDEVEDPIDDRLRYAFHSTRGLARAGLQQWVEALSDLQQADRERPGQRAVVDRMALSLFHLKRYDEALPLLRGLTASDPGSAAGQRLLAEALLRGGAAQPREERYAEALAAARAYRERRPGDPEADNLVGRAALGAGRHQEAVEALTRFLSAAPEHCPARVNLALGQFGLRRWDAAERELNAAAVCAPRSAELLETLALVYRMQQRLEEALATYERLYALRPSPEVEESIREVRYNLEAQAMNRAADEDDERIRALQEKMDRDFRDMQDKIDRYNRAVADD